MVVYTVMGKIRASQVDLNNVDLELKKMVVLNLWSKEKKTGIIASRKRPKI